MVEIHLNTGSKFDILSFGKTFASFYFVSCACLVCSEVVFKLGVGAPLGVNLELKQGRLKCLIDNKMTELSITFCKNKILHRLLKNCK